MLSTKRAAHAQPSAFPLPFLLLGCISFRGFLHGVCWDGHTAGPWWAQCLCRAGLQPQQPSNQGDSGVRAVLGTGMGFAACPLWHTRVSQGLRALPWCWEQEKWWSHKVWQNSLEPAWAMLAVEVRAVLDEWVVKDLGQTSRTGWWIHTVGANLGCCLFQE